MDELLTPKEVAAILKCGRDAAYTIIRRMKHVNIINSGEKNYLRVWKSDLLAWLEERETIPIKQLNKRDKPGKTTATIPHCAPRHSKNKEDITA